MFTPFMHVVFQLYDVLKCKFAVDINVFVNIYIRGHQDGARGHQVARTEHVGRSRACSDDSIKNDQCLHTYNYD